MSATAQSPATEQATWEALGGPGDFDALIQSLGNVAGVALDTHRRVRLAVALAALVRKGERFSAWKDGANVLLPLLVLNPEARAAAAELVRSHWSSSRPLEQTPTETPRDPDIRDWLKAVSRTTWLALLAVALVVAGIGWLASNPSTISVVMPPPGIEKRAGNSGQFWLWLQQLYLGDLMYRVSALAMVAAIGLVWWRQALREQTQRLRRERRQGQITKTLRLDPPAILTTATVRRAGRTLRRPVRVEGLRIDVRQTVNATVKAAGFLTLVRRWESRTPDCLLLVDRVSRNDQLSGIADALAKRLRDGGADVIRYEFRNFPDVLESAGRRFGGYPVLSMKALALRHAGARVVIVSTGLGFFEPFDRSTLRREPHLYGEPTVPLTDRSAGSVAGRLKPRLLPAFSGPPILLTPTPVDRWGPAEAALRQAGLAVTALGSTEDLYAGLVSAAEAVAEGRPAVSLDRIVAEHATPGADPLLVLLNRLDLNSEFPPIDQSLRNRVASSVVEYASARLGEAIEDNDAEDLFGHDAFAVRAMAGIAALAVFPRIEPALTSVLWRVATGHDPSLKRLSRLALLPWFRSGSMPDWLRADIAQCVKEEMTRRGVAEQWTQLRCALQSWTEKALGGSPGGPPVYSSKRDIAAWRLLSRFRRSQAPPGTRMLVEERLFLAFLESGEIPQDDLSITLASADRPTPAMRMAAVGFAIAALGLAALAPWLLQVTGALRPALSADNKTAVMAVYSGSVAFGAGLSFIRLVFPERLARLSWIGTAVIVLLSVIGQQVALLNAGISAGAAWLPAMPFAAISVIFFSRGAPSPVDRQFDLCFLSALGFFLPFDYFSNEDAFNALVFAKSVHFIIIVTYFNNQARFYAPFVILKINLFSSFVLALAIAGSLMLPVAYERTFDYIEVSASYCIVCAVSFSILLSGRDRIWVRRATFLAAAFLSSVAFPDAFTATTLPLAASLLSALGLALGIFCASWTASGRSERGLVAISRLRSFLGAVETPVRGLVVSAVVGAGLAALTALLLQVALVPFSAQLAQPFLEGAAINSVNSFLFAMLALVLFPVLRSHGTRHRPGAISGLLVLALVGSVAVVPDNVAAWLVFVNPLRGIAEKASHGVAAAWPQLAWIAVPIGVHFLSRQGSRVLGPVLVGMLPFATPVAIFGVAMPGGVWAIGLMLVLAAWMERPERLAWLRPQRADVSSFFDLLAHGAIISVVAQKVVEWQLRPWRLAAERLALAGAALGFVILLAPEVTLLAGFSGAESTFVDPQPMRATLFFLLGATALPRWPVRIVLVVLSLGSLMAPFQARLGDTLVQLELGLSGWAALELWFAYEVVPLTRWLRTLRFGGVSGLVVLALFWTWLSAGSWEEAAAGKAPVLLALLGMTYGLLRREPLLPLTSKHRATLLVEVLALMAVPYAVALLASRLPQGLASGVATAFAQEAAAVGLFAAFSVPLVFAFAWFGERLAPLLIEERAESSAQTPYPSSGTRASSYLGTRPHAAA